MKKNDFFELVLDDNESYLFTHFCKKDLSIAKDFYSYIQTKLNTNQLLNVLDSVSRVDNNQAIFDYMQKEVKDLVNKSLEDNLEDNLFEHRFFSYYVEHYTDWIHFSEQISSAKRHAYVLNFLSTYLSEPRIITEREFEFIVKAFESKKSAMPIHVLTHTNYTQELIDLGFTSSEASMRTFVQHAYKNPYLPSNFFETYYNNLDFFDQNAFKDGVSANYRHLTSLNEELTQNTISILKAIETPFEYSFELMSEPDTEIPTLYHIFKQTNSGPLFKMTDYLEHAMSLEQSGLFEYHLDLIDTLLEMTEDMPNNTHDRLIKLYNYISNGDKEFSAHNLYLFTDSMKENFLMAIEKSILNVTLPDTDVKKGITLKI